MQRINFLMICVLTCISIYADDIIVENISDVPSENIRFSVYKTEQFGTDRLIHDRLMVNSGQCFIYDPGAFASPRKIIAEYKMRQEPVNEDNQLVLGWVPTTWDDPQGIIFRALQGYAVRGQGYQLITNFALNPPQIEFRRGATGRYCGAHLQAWNLGNPYVIRNVT